MSTNLSKLIKLGRTESLFRAAATFSIYRPKRGSRSVFAKRGKTPQRRADKQQYFQHPEAGANSMSHVVELPSSLEETAADSEDSEDSDGPEDSEESDES